MEFSSYFLVNSRYACNLFYVVYSYSLGHSSSLECALSACQALDFWLLIWGPSWTPVCTVSWETLRSRGDSLSRPWSRNWPNCCVISEDLKGRRSANVILEWHFPHIYILTPSPSFTIKGHQIHCEIANRVLEKLWDTSNQWMLRTLEVTIQRTAEQVIQHSTLREGGNVLIELNYVKK